MIIMKPEDFSACQSAIFYYEHPWYANAKEIKHIFEEYKVGFYTTLGFTFIYCLEPPKYVMPAKDYDKILHLCGGKYYLQTYPRTEFSVMLDTKTYPYGDGRQYYRGRGRIFEFLEGEYKKEIEGIIIGPESDFMDRYGVKCDNTTIKIGDETFEGECSFLPSTDFIKLCTITEKDYEVKKC